MRFAYPIWTGVNFLGNHCPIVILCNQTSRSDNITLATVLPSQFRPLQILHTQSPYHTLATSALQEGHKSSIFQ